MTDPSSGAGVQAHVQTLRDAVEAGLSSLDLPASPSELYDPVRYVLAAGGKRLRPILLLLAAEAYGSSRRAALPSALAVEVFHNFTLVHDDIMDHADTRRGRETVHVRWDGPTAVLSGDYMMAMSYRLLTETPGVNLDELLRVFHEMVQDLCEGQALDKAFESISHVSLDAYMHMIDRKTGALLRASLELGGAVAGATASERRKLREIGVELGRAFQIQDDLLDLTAVDDRWGKTVGGDLIEGKKTFLLVRTLERAGSSDLPWFRRIVESGGLPAADVPEARARMESMGILDDARRAVTDHTSTAIETLSALEAGEQPLQVLRVLLDQMQARLH